MLLLPHEAWFRAMLRRISSKLNGGKKCPGHAYCCFTITVSFSFSKHERWHCICSATVARSFA